MSDVTPEAETPILPDGIGMTIEDVRTMLIRVHGTSIGKDDPLLMMVTLQNAFLDEYEKLLQRHNRALTAFLEAEGGKYLQAAQQASEAVVTGLSTSSVSVVQDTLQKFSKGLKDFQSNMTWLAIIVGIFAAINVATYVLRSYK